MHQDVSAFSNTAQTPFCSFEPRATIPSILKDQLATQCDAAFNIWLSNTLW
jgi:hypothetical protein